MKTFHFCVVLGLLLTLVMAPSVSAATDTTALYAPNEVLVKWKEPARALSGQQRLQSLGNTSASITGAPRVTDLIMKDDYTPRNFSVISSRTLTTEQLVERLRNAPTVAAVSVNPIFRPHAQTTPWGIDTNGLNAVDVHTQGYTGEGILVAVVDTGVNYTHEDLNDNIWAPTNGTCVIRGATVVGGCPNGGYDFVQEDAVPTDEDNHGTNVAGIIAAEDNSVGIKGVAPDATILIARALTYSSGSLADIVEAIDFAVENGAEVINMSLGSTYTGYILGDLQDAIADAEAAGIPLIGSSGNGATNAAQVPSEFEQVISVGAIQETASGLNPYANHNTRLAYFSNFGKVDVVGPGMGIMSTTDDGAYSEADMIGTSLAAPYISGAIALIREKNLSLTPAQIRTLVQTTAQDLGDTGKDDFFGSGLVDVSAAVAAANDASTKTVLLEGNWSENTTVDYVEGYYLEPTIYSMMLPADGTTTSQLRVRAATVNGTALVNETVTLSLSSGTILNSATATTDSNGIARFTILTPLTAGKATATVTLSSTGATDTITLRYADTLLVNDTGQPYTSVFDGWYHSQALEAAEANWRMDPSPYAVWIPTLAPYAKVIWSTGSYSLNTIEQELIKTYLDGGGNIFVTGGDILHTYYYNTVDAAASDPYGFLNQDVVLSSYFKVAYDKALASTLTFVGTGAADETGGFIGDYGDAEDNYYYTDVIAPQTGGTVSGYFCSNTEPALITVNSTYRSAFLSVSMDALDQSAMYELMKEVLAFLGGKTSSAGTFTTPNECDSSAKINNGSEEDPADTAIEVPAPLSSEVNPDLYYPTIPQPVVAVSSGTVTVSWDDVDYLNSSIAFARNTRTGVVEAESIGSTSSVTFTTLSSGETYDILIYGLYSSGYLSGGQRVTVTIHDTTTAPTMTKKTRYTVRVGAPVSAVAEERTRLNLYSDGGRLIKSVILSAGGDTYTFKKLDADTSYRITAGFVTPESDGSLTLYPASSAVSVNTFPDQITKIKIKEKLSTSVLVEWKRPTGNNVKKYTLQILKKKNGSYEKIASFSFSKKVNAKTFRRTITNLTPGTSYAVRVRTLFTNKEKGPFSALTAFKTPSDSQ